MPSTGAGSKSIARRFMRKSAATITRAKWLVAGTPVTRDRLRTDGFFHLLAQPLCGPPCGPKVAGNLLHALQAFRRRIDRATDAAACSQIRPRGARPSNRRA